MNHSGKIRLTDFQCFCWLLPWEYRRLLEIHNTKLQSIFNDWFNFHIDPIKTGKGTTVKKLIWRHCMTWSVGISVELRFSRNIMPYPNIDCHSIEVVFSQMLQINSVKLFGNEWLQLKAFPMQVKNPFNDFELIYNYQLWVLVIWCKCEVFLI